VIAVLICLLPGCRSTSPASELAEISQQLPVAAASKAAAGALPEMSIYHLGGTWQDQDGRELTLESLRGRPQVVALIYTRCKGACPRIVSELKALSAELAGVGVDPAQVGFLLVSMDPEVDSPEKLKELAVKNGLGPEWRLLRGNPEQVRELASLLSVTYRKVNETDFAHSNTISVVDANGVLHHQKEQLGRVEDSRKAVQGLVGDSACCPPTP
jgi:protein SCO1/2